MLEVLTASEGLLLGRRTYEGFAAAWPKMEGEFADKFNGMPKYVVSSTLSEPEWSNTTVLGSGKRLFGESSEKTPLKLTSSKTVGDGIAILVYEAAA